MRDVKGVDSSKERLEGKRADTTEIRECQLEALGKGRVPADGKFWQVGVQGSV